MTDRNKELVPYSWSPVREKTADHWTLFRRLLFWTLTCLQKSGAAGKEQQLSLYPVMSSWFCPGFISKHYSAPFSGLNKSYYHKQKRMATAKLQQHLNDKKRCSFLQLSPLGIYSLRPLPRPQVGVEEKGDSQLQGVDTHGVILGAVHVFLSHTRPNHPSVTHRDTTVGDNVTDTVRQTDTPRQTDTVR